MHNWIFSPPTFKIFLCLCYVLLNQKCMILIIEESNSGCDTLSLQILFMYFLALPSLLYPSILFNCFLYLYIQVCLMLQSWDNVANMHKLFTVSSHTQRQSISLAVSTVCMQQHELWTYYFIDHIPRCRSIAAARTHHCNGSIPAAARKRFND